MANLMSNMVESVRSRLAEMLRRHRKYSVSNELPQPLSIDYTMIPLSRNCKTVAVYYAAEAVAAYRKIISFYAIVSNDQATRMQDTYDEIQSYVRGWALLKEISFQNINTLKSGIARKLKIMRAYQERQKELLKNFAEANDPNVDMVDRAMLTMQRFAKEIPYKKVYDHLCHRDRINAFVVDRHLQDNVDMLDGLIQSLDSLNLGWDKVGKGEQYEVYREHQRELIQCIQDFATILEIDCELYENFHQMTETIISFKVYPSDKK